MNLCGYKLTVSHTKDSSLGTSLPPTRLSNLSHPHPNPPILHERPRNGCRPSNRTTEPRYRRSFMRCGRKRKISLTCGRPRRPVLGLWWVRVLSSVRVFRQSRSESGPANRAVCPVSPRTPRFMSCLTPKSSILRDLNIVRPNRTELRKEQCGRAPHRPLVDIITILRTEEA